MLDVEYSLDYHWFTVALSIFVSNRSTTIRDPARRQTTSGQCKGGGGNQNFLLCFHCTGCTAWCTVAGWWWTLLKTVTKLFILGVLDWCWVSSLYWIEVYQYLLALYTTCRVGLSVTQAPQQPTTPSGLWNINA